MNTSELRELLDEKYDEYCTPAFIDDDPISVPHYFSKKEDIEIAGFFAAMLAWGQRQQIIKSARNLMQMMDYAPFDFLTGATKKELNPFKSFVYRTFNGNDCVFFLHSLKNIYLKHQGLEAVFIEGYRRYGDLFAAIGMFRTVFLKRHTCRAARNIFPTPQEIPRVNAYTCFSVGWSEATTGEWILACGKKYRHRNSIVRWIYIQVMFPGLWAC